MEEWSMPNTTTFSSHQWAITQDRAKEYAQQKQNFWSTDAFLNPKPHTQIGAKVPLKLRSRFTSLYAKGCLGLRELSARALQGYKNPTSLLQTSQAHIYNQYPLI